MEGPNSEFRLQILGLDYFNEVLAFINEHFLPYEPIERGLEVGIDDVNSFHMRGIRNWLSSGSSVCSIHVPSKEIAGMCLNAVLSRTTPFTFLDAHKEDSEKATLVQKILARNERAVNYFENPSIQKVMEIAILAVDKNFSGKGVSYELLQRSEEIARMQHCQLIHAQATGPASQHIFKKCHYRGIKNIRYEDIEFDGQKVLNLSKMGGAVHVDIVCKFLEEEPI